MKNIIKIFLVLIILFIIAFNCTSPRKIIHKGMVPCPCEKNR